MVRPGPTSKGTALNKTGVAELRSNHAGDSLLTPDRVMGEIEFPFSQAERQHGGVNNSLEALFEDILTDRSFLHRIKVIQNLGNLLERVKAMMKYNSRSQFISRERAERIIGDMTRAGWFPRNLSPPTRSRMSYRSGKKKSISSKTKLTPSKEKSQPKTKVKKSASSAILANAGYFTGQGDKGQSLLDECTRALTELAAQEKNLPFRIVIPSKEMTLPLRTTWKRNPSSNSGASSGYKENRTSRLRTEYLRKTGPARQNTSVSSKEKAKEPAAGYDSSFPSDMNSPPEYEDQQEHSIIEREQQTDANDNLEAFDLDNSKYFTNALTTDCGIMTDHVEERPELENDFDRNGNCMETETNKISDKDGCKAEDAFDMSDLLEDADMDGPGCSMFYETEDEILLEATKYVVNQLDINSNVICLPEDDGDDDLHFTTGTKFWTDSLDDQSKVSGLNGAMDSDEKECFEEEFLKFRLYAELAEQRLAECLSAPDDTIIIDRSDSPNDSHIEDSNNHSVLPVKSAESSLLHITRVKASETLSDTSALDSQICVNANGISDEPSDDLGREGHRSPTLNLITTGLVAPGMLMRPKTSPVQISTTKDENYQMLLGFVGFPEIVRRRKLSKMFAPPLPLCAKPKHEKLADDGRSGIGSPLPSDALSEESLLKETIPESLLRKYNIPELSQMPAAAANASSEDTVAKNSVTSVLSSEDSSEVVGSEDDLTVEADYESALENMEPNTASVKDTLHMVADQLVENMMNTLVSEFAGLIFPTRM